MKHIDYTVLDTNLADEGEKKLQQTMGKMFVLQIIDGRLSVQRPLLFLRQSIWLPINSRIVFIHFRKK